jgi:electron transport complex protein RnfD
MSRMQDARRSSLAAAPHIQGKLSTRRMIWSVVICLLPAGAWGVSVFGMRAAGVLAVSVGSALVCELAAGALARRFSLADGSAFLTGLLVGFLMPPGVPLYVPAAASAFAILIVKQSFGGLGKNWMNPALAGWAFALFSWNESMSHFSIPWAAGGAPAALTPLAAVVSTLADPSGPRSGPFTVLNSRGYPFSAWDASVVSFINDRILSPLGAALPKGSMDLFVGSVAGPIGTVSALFLLGGAAYLISRRIVRWEIPASYIACFALLTWIFGGVRYGQGFFSGDIPFNVLTGGFLLGAFYMAPDPVTSPLRFTGRMLYGLLIGLFAFLLRFYGSQTEGVCLSILLMNCAVPLIDSLARSIGPRREPGRAA